jgi:phosphohistidine phosphatase
MNLLVIRHAIAEDKDEWAVTGEPDGKRPLTEDGRKKMKRGAKGLRKMVANIDLLATSPLTRAVQTAEIVAREFEEIAVVVTDSLDPARPHDAFMDWFRSLDEVSTVAVVGHDPHLSSLVSWLMTGRDGGIIELKKGAACMLEVDRTGAPGNARLIWALTPDQLRALRD